MKNNLILFFLLFFFTFKFSLAEKYDFEVSNITLSNDEKLINASEGKISTKNNDLTITAKEFKYFKNHLTLLWPEKYDQNSIENLLTN